MMSARKRTGTSRMILAAACFTLVWVCSAAGNQYVVNSTADAGTHTLRWAILQANATPGPDVITFDIPGAGPHAITPTSPLPPLTDQAGVILDGLSQPGSSAGGNPPASLTLQVLLDGVHAGAAPGIWLLSSNNLIQGLVITRFDEDGIRMQAIPEGCAGNVIRCCIIGLDVSGTDVRGNGTQIRNGRWAGLAMISVRHAPGNLFDNTVENNVISGNGGDGVIIADCPGGSVYRNAVSGNYIGTTRSGDVARGNGRDGILIAGGCYGITVSGNVIAGNTSDGVHITGDMTRSAYAHGHVITHNRIGISRLNRLIGNAINGVNVGGPEYGLPGGFASKNSITSNIIAGNMRSGVTVWEHDATANNGDHNRISQNSIFSNARFPVDLGNDGMTLNDAADLDAGPNENLNTPIILAADFSGGVTTVRGTVTCSADPTTMTVEIFRHFTQEAVEFSGTLFLGRVSPDESGNWIYSTTGLLFPGDHVTAQAIDRHDNSSEYARERAVAEGGALPTENSAVLLAHDVGMKASAMIADATVSAIGGGVRFTISVQRPCWGILEVFTPTGELVRTLVNRWLPAGDYTIEWDGKNWRGRQVGKGSFICRFDADGIRQSTNIAL